MALLLAAAAFTLPALSQTSREVEVVIGRSNRRIKTVTVNEVTDTLDGYLDCPTFVNKDNWTVGMSRQDEFRIVVNGDQVTAIRTDRRSRWGLDLRFTCQIEGEYIKDTDTFIRWDQCPHSTSDFCLSTDYDDCVREATEACDNASGCVGVTVYKLDPYAEGRPFHLYTDQDCNGDQETDDRHWDFYKKIGEPMRNVDLPLTTDGYTFKFSVLTRLREDFEAYDRQDILVYGQAFGLTGTIPEEHYGDNAKKVAFHINTEEGVGGHGRGGGSVNTNQRLVPGEWYTLTVEKTADQVCVELDNLGKNCATRTVPAEQFKMKVPGLFHVAPPGMMETVLYRDLGTAMYEGAQLYSSTVSDVNRELTFNTLYKNSGTGVIKRECPSCPDSHKTIYYKRLTDVGDFRPYNCMINTWATECDGKSNILNQDFELYSTLEDLQEGQDRWSFCNYNDPGIGFPRDCGKNGPRAHIWNSVSRGGRNVVYYTMNFERKRVPRTPRFKLIGNGRECLDANKKVLGNNGDVSTPEECVRMVAEDPECEGTYFEVRSDLSQCRCLRIDRPCEEKNEHTIVTLYKIIADYVHPNAQRRLAEAAAAPLL